MSNAPLVCVCVPTYNAMQTVRETLESILAQTYPNFVIHVSDNASTDDTVNIVESIKDPRLFLHRNVENIGGEGNFTRCIQLATGEYTILFHADDVAEPEMLARQVEFLESNPDVGAAFTAARTIDKNGNFLGIIGRAPSEGKTLTTCYGFPDLFKAVLKYYNFLVCPSVLVRTHLYQNEIREWGNRRFKSSSDLDVWLRLAQVMPVAILNQTLMRYRISDAQFSQSVRAQTGRSDFFLVIDDYLARTDVTNFVTEGDLRNYRGLERRENIARALNFGALGCFSEAKALLNGFFCRETFFSALQGKKGVLTLVVGSLLKIVLGIRSKRFNLSMFSIIIKMISR